MSTKISFLLNIIVLFLISCVYTQASELKIIPLKKPILTDEIIEKKKTQNIIKPKKKPKKKVIAEEEIKPQKKPKKQIVQKKESKPQKKTKKKIAESKKKLELITPKKKPLVVEKKISKAKKKSKYYRKKDFNLAKKAITAMEKKKMVQSFINKQES